MPTYIDKAKMPDPKEIRREIERLNRSAIAKAGSMWVIDDNGPVLITKKKVKYKDGKYEDGGDIIMDAVILERCAMPKNDYRQNVQTLIGAYEEWRQWNLAHAKGES